jgi:hypothetical protein
MSETARPEWRKHHQGLHVRLLVLLGALGIALALPTAAGAQQSRHPRPSHPRTAPSPYTTATTTAYCFQAARSGGEIAVPVAVVTTTADTYSTTPTVVGVTSVTGGSPGRTLWFTDDFRIISSGPSSGDDVSGVGVFGGGADLLSPVIYLQGASATIDHYGNPSDITGPSQNVCQALGITA